MVVEKDKTITNGSNALKTNVAIERKKTEKQKSLNKKKVDKQKILKQRLKFIRNVACSFAVGVFILSRYSAIYNSQMEINKLKDDIYKVKAENESMKVQLIKFNNLSYIENIAINELGMKKPEASKALYMNLTTNDNNATSNDGSNASSKSFAKNFLEKLKNLLF
ncbi:MAG: septum formation initiator family protein [Clostridium sp.]